MDYLPEAEFRLLHQEVLASERWHNLRQRLIRNRRGCQICGTFQRLEIHHLTYDNLGHESPKELVILCHYHHQQVTYGVLEVDPYRGESELWRWIKGWLHAAWSISYTKVMELLGKQPFLYDYDFEDYLDALTCYQDYMVAQKINKNDPERFQRLEQLILRTIMVKEHMRVIEKGKALSIERIR